jgi:hypothetical protein
MLTNLPTTPEALIAWTWSEIEPYYKNLDSFPLTAENVQDWLTDWTRLGEKVDEMYSRLSVATSINTADKEADERMNRFLDGIFPPVMAAEQKLKEKLLASKLEPQGFEIPLRNMRAEADLFRAANLPLLSNTGIRFRCLCMRHCNREQARGNAESQSCFGKQPRFPVQADVVAVGVRFRDADRIRRPAGQRHPQVRRGP